MLGARAVDAVNMLRDQEVIGKCDSKNLLAFLVAMLLEGIMRYTVIHVLAPTDTVFNKSPVFTTYKAGPIEDPCIYDAG